MRLRSEPKPYVIVEPTARPTPPFDRDAGLLRLLLDGVLCDG